MNNIVYKVKTCRLCGMPYNIKVEDADERNVCPTCTIKNYVDEFYLTNQN